MNKKILLVDDDLEIRTLLKGYLERNQYEVISCADGAQFMAEFERHNEQLSLVILDIMLPDSDGFILCRHVRKHNNDVPVFMLTATAEESDRVVGLELGADDYIAKPFSARELLARIKAIHRRFDVSKPQDEQRYYHFANFVLDTSTRLLLPKDHSSEIVISGIDYQLILYFVQHSQVLVSRNQLSEATRGRDVGPHDRFLDVQISRLRQKLNDDGKLIKTIRGQGYLLDALVSQSNER